MVKNFKAMWPYKINQQVKELLDNWILHHPQLVQSPIAIFFLRVSIDGIFDKQLVPKLLLRVSEQELQNIMVITQEGGGLKEARDKDNTIVMSDSTLRNILTK